MKSLNQLGIKRLKIDQILNSNDCYNGWFLITKYLVENYDKKFIFSLIKSNCKAIEVLQNELYNNVNKKYNKFDYPIF